MDSSVSPTASCPLSVISYPPPASNDPMNTGFNAQPGSQPQVHRYDTGWTQPSTPIGAPEQCEQGFREHYPNIQLGPDQPPIFRRELPSERWTCAAPCSIAAYTAFVVCIYFMISRVPYYTGTLGYGGTAVICASVFLCLSYLVAVIEGSCSKVDRCLHNVTLAAHFLRKHDKLRQTVPTIEMTAVASHQVGPDDHSHTVTTHKEHRTFPFTTCIDVSGPMEAFKSGTTYRIESEKTFAFLNQHTADEYEQMKTGMIERASHDKHQSFTMRFHIPKFKNLGTICTKEDSRPKFLSPNLYLLLTFFLCSWPYRIFFWSSTKKRNYTYVKLINV